MRLWRSIRLGVRKPCLRFSRGRSHASARSRDVRTGSRRCEGSSPCPRQPRLRLWRSSCRSMASTAQSGSTAAALQSAAAAPLARRPGAESATPPSSGAPHASVAFDPPWSAQAMLALLPRPKPRFGPIPRRSHGEREGRGQLALSLGAPSASVAFDPPWSAQAMLALFPRPKPCFGPIPRPPHGEQKARRQLALSSETPSASVAFGPSKHGFDGTKRQHGCRTPKRPCRSQSPSRRRVSQSYS